MLDFDVRVVDAAAGLDEAASVEVLQDLVELDLGQADLLADVLSQRHLRVALGGELTDRGHHPGRVDAFLYLVHAMR